MIIKKRIDNEVKAYCDAIKSEWFPLDCLDDSPKKSVAQQVEDLILNNVRLQDNRIAMTNLSVSDDEDLDQVQDLDEYADRYEAERMADYLIRKRQKMNKDVSRETSPPADDSPVSDSGEKSDTENIGGKKD